MMVVMAWVMFCYIIQAAAILAMETHDLPC